MTRRKSPRAPTCSVGAASRLAPVEPPDQLGANRLHPGFEANAVECAVVQSHNGAAAVVSARHEVLRAVLCQPILAPQEQAGQPTQVVFEAAAGEPTTRAKAPVRYTGEIAVGVVDRGPTLEARLRIAAADVGQDGRSDQVSEPRADSPRLVQLCLCNREWALLLNITFDAAEVDICKCPDDPAIAHLHIKAAADGAEPTPATLASGSTQDARSVVSYYDGVSSPHAVAAAAFEVEAGPVVNRHCGHRRGLVDRRCGHRRGLGRKIHGVCWIAQQDCNRRRAEDYVRRSCSGFDKWSLHRGPLLFQAGEGLTHAADSRVTRTREHASKLTTTHSAVTFLSIGEGSTEPLSAIRIHRMIKQAPA